MPLSSYKLISFIATRDAARARAFYGGVLGLRFVSEDPFAVVFDAHGNMLRITPVKEIAPGGYTVLGWEVPDIALAAAELQKAGVEFLRYPGMNQDEAGIWHAPGGACVAWFTDPDGNILSISQHPG
jgi:catechol 2,3-dioxygenase-like lactoylglutathione lyase family enzyme